MNQTFQLFMDARSFSSAFEAQSFGLLRDRDTIIMSSDHVLAQALTVARRLAPGYHPAPTVYLTLPDPGQLQTPSGDFSTNDMIIADALKNLLSVPGGQRISAEELGSHEATSAGEVIILPSNVERASHMARTRKPLKN